MPRSIVGRAPDRGTAGPRGDEGPARVRAAAPLFAIDLNSIVSTFTPRPSRRDSHAPSAADLLSPTHHRQSEPELGSGVNSASNDASNGASNGASTAPPDPDEMEDAALTEAAKYVLASRGRWSVAAVLSGDGCCGDARAAPQPPLRDQAPRRRREGEGRRGGVRRDAVGGRVRARAHGRGGRRRGGGANAKRWLGAWKTRVESEAVSGAGAHPGTRGAPPEGVRNPPRTGTRTSVGGERTPAPIAKDPTRPTRATRVPIRTTGLGSGPGSASIPRRIVAAFPRRASSSPAPSGAARRRRRTRRRRSSGSRFWR